MVAEPEASLSRPAAESAEAITAWDARPSQAVASTGWGRGADNSLPIILRRDPKSQGLRTDHRAILLSYAPDKLNKEKRGHR